MREPGSIERILEVLRKTWEAQPDLRLGQLIMNCIDAQGFTYGLGVRAKISYIEDEDMEELLKDMGGGSER